MKIDGLEIDRQKLLTEKQALDFLRENGRDYGALSEIGSGYYEVFGWELYWPYPICDGENAGLFILSVQEGFLCLPYDAIDAQDHELLELDRAFMLDTETAESMLDEWNHYSASLSGSMTDMLRILRDEQEQIESAAPDEDESIGIPNEHLQTRDAIDLVATYEGLFDVPPQERLTHYFGDYGMHFRKHGVTDEQFRPVYAKALQAIEMDSEAYHDRHFVFRGEVETAIRCRMLAQILEPGDEIVFVPPSPTGADGEWQYEAGCVNEVNTTAQSCVVSFENGEVIIPFRYVLARFRDQNFEGNAFGFEQAEPILGLPENWANDFLREAQREYEQQNSDMDKPDEGESQNMTMG